MGLLITRLISCIVADSYAVIGIAGLALHAYTTVTAFNLWDSGATRYLAAVGAWALPGIAEVMVAMYKWQATGSRVNDYSVWILVRLALVLALGSLQNRNAIHSRQ